MPTKPTVTITDLRGTNAGLSVVPTCQQIQQQAAAQAEADRKKKLMEMNDEQWAEKMSEMPMSEMLKGLRDQLHLAYKNASFMLIGTQPKNSEYTTISFEYTGQEEALTAALCECMQHSKVALKMMNRAIHLFCMYASEQDSETAISEFQGIIKDLQQRNTPETQIRLKQAELKRLKKSGRLDLASVKEQEIAQLNRDIEAAKVRAQKEADLYKTRCERLVLAREALRQKREKARRQAEQRNNPQPNFAKMAKKRRQEIAARQAEKKKKKAAGSGDGNVKSCSQLLNR